MSLAIILESLCQSVGTLQILAISPARATCAPHKMLQLTHLQTSKKPIIFK